MWNVEVTEVVEWSEIWRLCSTVSDLDNRKTAQNDFANSPFTLETSINLHCRCLAREPTTEARRRRLCVGTFNFFLLLLLFHRHSVCMFFYFFYIFLWSGRVSAPSSIAWRLVFIFCSVDVELSLALGCVALWLLLSTLRPLRQLHRVEFFLLFSGAFPSCALADVFGSLSSAPIFLVYFQAHHQHPKQI